MFGYFMDIPSMYSDILIPTGHFLLIILIFLSNRCAEKMFIPDIFLLALMCEKCKNNSNFLPETFFLFYTDLGHTV